MLKMSLLTVSVFVVVAVLTFTAVTRHNHVAALSLPTFIDSDMVLQRSPMSARVWGFANASDAHVVVTLDGSNPVTAVPDTEGIWEVELAEQEASTGRTIAIKSSSGHSIILTNIAFGDVYLCSGQSNMEFSVNTAFNASEEIADAINYPNLRLFTAAKVPASSPQNNVGTKSNYTWGVSGPATMERVGGPSFSWFSATCYFFGRDVYKALDGKVPIGLVASDWGGQKVEAFSSPDALNDKTCGGTRNASFQYTTQQPNSNNINTEDGSVEVGVPDMSLWYEMIYPFLRMRFKGAAWYQGEANAGDPASYACRFPAMIHDWRLKMNLTLPFLFVQLAAYSSDYAEIRHAQMAALLLDNVAYAIAIDIGDPTSPEGNIHPRRKQEVGRRLHLSALKVIYGQDVENLGPQVVNYTTSTNEDKGTTSISITFSHADNLHSYGTAACTECCSQSPFQISNGGSPVRAPFVIKGNTIELSANITGKNLQISYDWEGYPQCALYNGEGGPDNHTGLPADPFQTPSPPPINYTLLFRQTWPDVYTPGEWSLNSDDPTQDMYSILDQWEKFQGKSGLISLKLRWPMVLGAQHWKQTSNPTNSTTVTGYKTINVTTTAEQWGGLALNGQDCLLDGSQNPPRSSNWYFTVGSFSVWGGGIPYYDPKVGASTTELYVRSNTGGWTLVFRQTMPYLFSANEFALNADNPDSPNFAILDQLESFRSKDGSFEFKMVWPEVYNTWYQTSNPVKNNVGGVSGYEAGRIMCNDRNWGGLEFDEQHHSLLDGSIGNSDLWFFAVGDFGTSPWGQQGIPACGSLTAQQQVELLAAPVEE
eukprot:m.20567 g.20567  ORF g.20567 m.20567 type:complete len:821 (+) comp8585_c0_seq8:86-2548(+)